MFTAGGRIRVARVVVATGMPTHAVQVAGAPLLVPDDVSRADRAGAGEDSKGTGPPRRGRARSGRSAAHRALGRRSSTARRPAPTRPPAAAPARTRAIVQRTGQLMYELSTLYPDISGLQPEFGWAADYARTAERLPYLGPHRNFPYHLFAFGDSSHSVTGAYLASRVLLRQYFEEMDPADEALRIHPLIPRIEPRCILENMLEIFAFCTAVACARGAGVRAVAGRQRLDRRHGHRQLRRRPPRRHRHDHQPRHRHRARRGHERKGPVPRAAAAARHLQGRRRSSRASRGSSRRGIKLSVGQTAVVNATLAVGTRERNDHRHRRQPAARHRRASTSATR